MSGSTSKKDFKNKREEREQILRLKFRYENRVTTAKQGKYAYQAGDYGGCIKKYTEYLQILSEVFSCEIYTIELSHFDKEREITEMLLLSQIYFELARIYDLSPNFKSECEKCLQQFVVFTSNQRYQIVNSEMLRKYIKKDRFKNPDLFKNALLKIQVNSKKCFIATSCFGEEDPSTQRLRNFKQLLLTNNTGQYLTHTYYKFSTVFVDWLEEDQSRKKYFVFALKPVLWLFSRFF